MMRRKGFLEEFMDMADDRYPIKSYGRKVLKFAVIGLVAMIVLNIMVTMVAFEVGETESVVVKNMNQISKVYVGKKTPEMEEQIKNNNNLKNVKIIEGKGLFFKWPFIESVEPYSSRLLTYDTNPREVVTKDKKKLILDNYAQWRIVNPVVYAMTIKNEVKAHTRLDDIIYSKINEEVGKLDAHTVISDKQKTEEVTNLVTAGVNELVKEYGMEVVDVRIKRTNLPPENYANIYNRMKSEREKEAKTYRSEGDEEAQKIKSNADKEATIVRAQAYEKSERIKGEGDAEATRIYADAYNVDPDFYSFYRTLITYKNTLKNKTKIVIDQDSEFAKYLFGK